MDYKALIKTHQLKIALTAGYLLVATLAFGLGRMTVHSQPLPEIRVEQSAASPDNYNPIKSGIQSNTQANSSTTAKSAGTQTVGDCTGRIKGSSSHIYHLPGGAFYEKTTHPIACFDTEAAAQVAGFRKSSR